MPTPLIAANWKMHTTLREAEELTEALKAPLSAVEGAQVVLCPPFISLSKVGELIRGTPLKLGAQNVHYEEQGAFTGEVSLRMLQGLCEYVIVGHSERRHLFGESDELVNRKLRAVLEAGLKPILCVGERLEQREAGRAEEMVRAQLGAALDGVDHLRELAVAYEPVWAIGTGRAATGEIANAMMGLIRSFLADHYGNAAAEVPLLYGGSVTSQNIDQFVQEEHVGGALVGGASLRAEEFIQIVQKTAQVKGAG